MKGHCIGCLGFYQVHLVCGGRFSKNPFLGRLMVGGSTFGFLILGILRIFINKNLPISSILGSFYAFSWNFNFCHNLSNFKIEDLKRLMFSVTCIYLH